MNKLMRNQFFELSSVFLVGLLLLGSVATGRAQGKEDESVRLRVTIIGIPGDGVGGAIEAVGSDQALAQAAGDGSGGPSAGKVEFAPVVITKAIDSATPRLSLSGASGQRLSEVRINWVRSNQRRRDGEEVYFTVVLQDVQIVSVRTRLPNQNDPKGAQLGPLEEVAFSFGRIQWIYTLPSGGTVRTGWDLKANRSL